MRSLVGLASRHSGLARRRVFGAVALLVVSATVSRAQIVKTIEEYPLPAGGSPVGITAGRDGALWFVEAANNRIGRITTAGVITEYPVPTTGSEPVGIAAGPDGALWFAEVFGNQIGRITTAGVIREYSLPTDVSGPQELAAGPDGALWFTEVFGNRIGRITTAGIITEYSVPTANSKPVGITAGPDGALWFTEFYGNRIGRITTAGVITEYSVPTAGSAPSGIAAGPDGALWFAEVFGNQIGRITTAGIITEYPVPTAGGTPTWIAAGPDGALWFTEVVGHQQIGCITTAGVITEYSVPTADSEPEGIVAGPDGALWFTEEVTNQIGQVVLAVSPRQRFARPMPMGVSVGNTPTLPFLSAGTAGLLVRSVSTPDSKFILSNNHVLGAVSERLPLPPRLCPNTATKGKTWTLQPGTFDIRTDPGNNPNYHVGTVANFWPLTHTGKNAIDAAISLASSSLATTEVLGIGTPNPVVGYASPHEGVVKSGRTTGVTAGTVTGVNATVTVNYHGCGRYTFAGQIAIFPVSPGPFSSPGDAGSAILDSTTLTPVGLLFAGSPWRTLANPISSVYNLMQVLPDGPAGASPNPAKKLKARGDSWRGMLDPRLAPLKEIQARHEDALLSVPGVHGVAVGLDEDSQDLVFQVYVTKRTPELGRTIPREIEGVPVRFVETGGEFVAY